MAANVFTPWRTHRKVAAPRAEALAPLKPLALVLYRMVPVFYQQGKCQFRLRKMLDKAYW